MTQPAKYQITLAASFLYSIGYNFWKDGTLSRGNVKLFDYYRGDPVSDDIRQRVREWCPDALIGEAFIGFPKAGYYRLSPRERAKFQEPINA